MSSSLPKEKPDFAKLVHEVPHKPGVYLMRDRFNRVIYVGKARDLRKRVGSYFLPSKMAQADLKTRAMLVAVWDFETHTVQSEAESLLLEGKLIKEFRPRYNISFRDDKRFLLVKVDPTEEWPRFRLARFKKDDGARYFGPYAHAGALRQTLNFMRKKFGVLTFGRGSPTERELKSSTYQVPVRLSETNAEQYRERVAQASDFLEGHSREMIGVVEDEMQKAAAKLDFEKAAELRNMLEDLKRTTKPMRRFTRHSLPSAIDPVSDVQSLADALRLERLPVVMECFDISNISTTHVVASMVCFRGGVPDKDNYRRYRIRTVAGQDDFASMAEVVRRRYARVLLEARAANPEAAEFSQEETVEGLRRLEGETSNIRRSTSTELAEERRRISARSSAGFDHRRWRQRAALVGVQGVAAAWAPRFADHRAGQGTRGNLSAGARFASATADGFRRVAVTATDPRRGASFCEHLSPTADEKAHRREHSGRLSGRQSEPEKFAPAKIRLGQSPAESDGRADRGDGRDRTETGRGRSSFPGAALTPARFANA